jgi:transcriptional regulator with XRE-family HTH domain
LSDVPRKPPRAPDADRLRTIGDVFYETRVRKGRGFSLRRFADEVLGGRIEPVMLSYIEKGERFPNEDLVRHLAAARREDPQPLLALLWRDRILYAIARELDRAFEAQPAVGDTEDGELAVRLSRAMAALPDDASWVAHRTWRRTFRRERKPRKRSATDESALDAAVEATLREHGLIEIRAGKVRRRGRHYQAETRAERRAVAHQFAQLFAKGLVDRVALPDAETGTYLRNHYLNVERSRIPEFHQALEDALRELTERFAADPSDDTEFMNVLATATPR